MKTHLQDSNKSQTAPFQSSYRFVFSNRVRGAGVSPDAALSVRVGRRRRGGPRDGVRPLHRPRAGRHRAGRRDRGRMGAHWTLAADGW